MQWQILHILFLKWSRKQLIYFDPNCIHVNMRCWFSQLPFSCVMLLELKLLRMFYISAICERIFNSLSNTLKPEHVSMIYWPLPWEVWGLVLCLIVLVVYRSISCELQTCLGMFLEVLCWTTEALFGWP